MKPWWELVLRETSWPFAFMFCGLLALFALLAFLIFLRAGRSQGPSSEAADLCKGEADPSRDHGSSPNSGGSPMKDWWKTVITINTGLLALPVLFLRGRPEILAHKWLLILFWLFVFSSLCCSMVNLWGWSSPRQTRLNMLRGLRECARNFAESPASSLIAHAAFVLGVACLILFIGLNL